MPKLSCVEIEAECFLNNQETWIDRRGNPKIVPMRVLCVGLNRTGTSSLRVALHDLGYATYHGWSLMENPPDCVLWNEAIAAKEGDRGRLLGREYFDSVFCDSDACMDIPTSVFAEDLINAYPDAKVIITTRDFEAWYKSMMKTIVTDVRQIHDFIPRALRKLDKAVGIYIPTMFRCFFLKYGDTFAGPNSHSAAKAAYLGHLEMVRSLARAGKRSYLEFDVKQGYGPLCSFLGKDVPRDESGNMRPFPRVNDAASYMEIFRHMFLRIMLERLKEWAVRLATVGIIAFGAWRAVKK